MNILENNLAKFSKVEMCIIHEPKCLLFRIGTIETKLIMPIFYSLLQNKDQ